MDGVNYNKPETSSSTSKQRIGNRFDIYRLEKKKLYLLECLRDRNRTSTNNLAVKKEKKKEKRKTKELITMNLFSLKEDE